MAPNEPEESFPARIYWFVAIAAVAWMIVLYLITRAFHVPMEGA